VCLVIGDFVGGSSVWKVMLICIYLWYIPWGCIVGKASAVTVKVSDELKEKMKRVRVNWSEYIRQAIQRKIEEQKVKAASVKIDEVRKRAKPVSTDELVSWIREDRER